MDTFMDKLAQRFTAQEMIKANSAAETEEMNRLKEQVKEYSACLTRMEQICEQMDETAEAVKTKMESAHFDTDGLREELLQMWQELQGTQAAQIKGIQQEQLDSLKGIQSTQFEAMQNSYEDQVDRIRSMVKAQLSSIKDGQIDGLKGILEAQGQETDTKLGELKTAMETQLSDFNEFIHKECVKVYRNVQAVVIDENNKQVENLDYTLKPTLAKVKKTYTISVLALIVSLAGVVLQILSIFQII